MTTLTEITTDDLVAELRRRRELISAAIDEHFMETPEVRRVLEAVAHAFGCPVARLFRRSRTDRIVHPRQAAMVLLISHSALNLTEIGRIFGKDHGTVMHARDTHPARLLDPHYAAAFRAADDGIRNA